MVNQKFIVDYMTTEYSRCEVWNEETGRYDKNIGSHLTDHYMGSRLDTIEDLYKALCFVAGKKIDERLYSPFKHVVLNHCTEHGTWFYFDWFRVKFYKKGTMHFEFTDINVWYRFNQIAAQAKGWKLGSQTQCKSKKAWRDIETPRP